jgi:hypothetical protein
MNKIGGPSIFATDMRRERERERERERIHYAIYFLLLRLITFSFILNLPKFK